MMDEKTIQKIKLFVKKNPYPSYELVEKMLLRKAQDWKDKGDMELKSHYLMMNSEYGHNNHNAMKNIYENIENEELIRRIGETLFIVRGMPTMIYNSTAFIEILNYLINENAKTKFERVELYYKMRLQLNECWDGIGEWSKYE